MGKMRKNGKLKKLVIGLSVSAVLICALAAFGIENGSAPSVKKTSTYYDGFNFYNIFKVGKSEGACGQAPDLVWKPENVQFKKGELILALNKDENGLSAGELYSKQKYGYGLYQVRMKPVGNTGVVSSFFNYAETEGLGTEIDIEFLGKDTTKVQFNYYANGVGNHECLYDLGFDAAEDYHVYSFYWTSDAIYWYVDGTLAYEAHDDIPSLEASIIVDAWTGDHDGWHGKYDGKAPLYAYYDWISYTSLEDMKAGER